MDEAHSFKLVGRAQDIIKNPGHMLLLAAMLGLAMVNAHVSNQFTAGRAAPDEAASMVLGEATSSENTDQENLLNMYRLSMQSLLIPYLEQRSIYLGELEQDGLVDGQRSDWLGLAQQAQSQVSDVLVPTRHKDTHLLVVAALLEDIAVLEANSIIDLDTGLFGSATARWSDILSGNQWLNDRQPQ